MRLIEDDGTVIELIPDDCAVIVIKADGEPPDLFSPVIDDSAEVPDHILLAGAVLNALIDEHGRTQIMSHLPPDPAKRN